MSKTIGLMIAITVLFVAGTGAVAFAIGRSMDDGQSRQEAVAARGATVMPFDQNRSPDGISARLWGGEPVVGGPKARCLRVERESRPGEPPARPPNASLLDL